MPYIQTGKSSIASPVSIYYEDTGVGKPVVFIHGWPLDSRMWEYQVNELPKRGIRCITYDRRGFGNSDTPVQGYDYDTLAADLRSVIEELNLSSVTLVGFSMGGGEVARYIARYGTENIDRIVLVSSIKPFMLKTSDNPDGIPQSQFDEFEEQIREDRPAFMDGFAKTFYGVGFLNKPVSQAFLDWNQTIVMHSSAKATLECLKSLSTTDFRMDLPKINVKTLIIHGDNDKTVPIDLTARNTVKMVKGAELKIYAGEPHGIFYTQKDSLNQNLIDFIFDSNENFPAQNSDIPDPLENPLRFPNTGLV